MGLFGRGITPQERIQHEKTKWIEVDTSAEYALLVRGHYGDVEMAVEVLNKSDRVDKQRAEVLTLVAGLLEWARGQGIEYEGARVWYAR